ncbi:esterase [Pandoraea pneumonica]|uniref:Esterase n=2 Tax=Pandoraea pneumonica TaxID=2508299 RepID=A0A5E4YRH0_9BURK|nr:esterase [Pandoraea pneumonica]
MIRAAICTAIRGGRAFAGSCFIAVLVMSGCASLDRNEHAEALAAPAGLHRETLQTPNFVLTAFSRITRADAPVRIYIEGDGLAWLSRTEPSLDPTPVAATGLSLAAVDPSANVVYLARPCQFTPMAMNPRCGIPYWTGKRFAPEVIEAMNDAVSRIAARVPGQRIELIGYSGGGAVAALIAARRQDVASLRTVAGNLDVAYVNELHHVSPMPESRNPIDVATKLVAMPQVHFSGSTDTVVPPAVAARFAAAVGGRCVITRVVDGITHDGDWAQQWPAMLRVVPRCEGGR